jgi:ribonucleoside-triphosphate reductase
MENYVEHNCSITVSYDPDEVPQIIDWFMKDENWDIYKGISFIFKNDPTKSALDLGFPYLPQEIVEKETYEEYVSKLLPFELDKKEKDYMFTLEMEGCAGGACPVR